MSFKPKGASLPSNFKKQSGFKARPADVLCVVESYDLAKGAVRVKDLDRDRVLEVRINPEKAALAPRRGADEKDTWHGNMIDARMAEALQPGRRIVLEAALTEKKIKTPEGDVFLARCNWIIAPPSNDPTKSFRSHFTVSSWDGRIVSVQDWGADACAINPDTAEGADAINALADEMQKVADEAAAGGKPIGRGVQFRVIVPGPEKDGKPTYMTKHSSPPLDWLTDEVEQDGAMVKKGRPVNGDDMVGLLTDYQNYVFGSEDQNAPDAEPGLVRRNAIPAEFADKMIIEVMPYRVFRTSKYADSMDVENPRAPLHRLANVVTKYEIGDDSSYVGKNWAVNGVIVLTDDQAPKVKGDDWKTMNMVSRLFTNGYSCNVHSAVRSFDGARVSVDPWLDRVREDAPAPVIPDREAQAAASSAAPAAVAASPLTPAPDIFGDADDGAGNFYSTAVGAVPEQTVAPEAPAASEAAAPEEPAPQGRSGGRFERRRPPTS